MDPMVAWETEDGEEYVLSLLFYVSTVTPNRSILYALPTWQQVHHGYGGNRQQRHPC
jgi:hypothetical protein